MKFSLPREVLLSTLQSVIGAVEKRQTMPVLGFLFLHCEENRLSVTATDLEVELQATQELMAAEPGTTTLPARKFFDICKALPDEVDISVAVDGDRAIVTSGRSRFTLTTLPAADFPLLEDVPLSREIGITERELKRLIDRTAFAMANQDVRYYLNGLLLEATSEHLRTVATDGHRLSLAEFVSRLDVSSETLQVIIPRKGIMELSRLLEPADEAIRIGFGTNYLRIQLPRVRFTTKLIDGRFPDYNRVIPEDGDKIVKVDRETLRQALQRASILSNEKYRGIRLALETGNLKIQAHNPEQEEAEEELDVDYFGDTIEIGFNANYLLDALGAVEGEFVELILKDAGSSALVRAEAGAPARYVVMPMRL